MDKYGEFFKTGNINTLITTKDSFFPLCENRHRNRINYINNCKSEFLMSNRQKIQEVLAWAVSNNRNEFRKILENELIDIQRELENIYREAERRRPVDRRTKEERRGEFISTWKKR